MRVAPALLVLLAAHPAHAQSRATPEDIAKAVGKTVAPLLAGYEGHSAKRTCFTCHNHAVPLVALTLARSRGIDVDAERLADARTFLTDYLEDNRERMLKGRGPGDPISGETDTSAYLFLSLDAVGHAPDPCAEALVAYQLSKDRSRDHWRTPIRRHPSESSSFMTTGLALLGVERYAAAGRKAEAQKRAEAARGWLVKTPAADTEDRVFRLIGLKAAGAPADAVAAAARELAGTQREDGGWGQTGKLAPDAYATGSALYALATAGGLAPDDPAYRRGLAFLLGSQQPDGTWRVKTRSRPVQTHFESGFPHGKDQFISCAATGWSAAALALALPVKP